MEKLVKQIVTFYSSIQRWPGSKDWLIKALSLLFAVFLWYFVVGEDKVDTSVTIPVEIINLPQDLIISNQFKKELEVTVSGSRGLIRSIERQNISRSVDLSDVKPGTMVVQNKAESIPLPRGIRILRIQPTHIMLLLDRLIHKDLAVKPVLNGKPPEGYEIVSVHLDPPSLSLTGPQAVLTNETHLLTEPIDVNTLTASTLEQIKLDLKPEIADLIGETGVTAQINIKEKKVRKTLSAIPVELNNIAKGFSYRVKPKSIKVQADLLFHVAKETKDLKSLFHATADVKKLLPGKHEVAIHVTAKNSTSILEVAPQTATVEIKKKPPVKTTSKQKIIKGKKE